MSEVAKRVPPVRYVTLFPGRTGSTYLASHMVSHPQVCARYEILSRHSDSWETQIECIRTLCEQKHFPVIRAVGFKAKLTKILDRQAFRRYLLANDFRVIHQIRRNRLKYIVSVIRANLLRSEHGRSNVVGDEKKKLGAIEIPVPIFTRALKRFHAVDRLKKFVDKLEVPKLTVAYEDLLQDERGTLQRVWDFIDVPPVETEGFTKKATPDNIREAVTNIDEIVKAHPDMAEFVDE